MRRYVLRAPQCDRSPLPPGFFFGSCFFATGLRVQLREARAEAEAAGEATRKDIEKLRALHAKRVRRLEALLKEEGDNLADARREIGAVQYDGTGVCCSPWRQTWFAAGALFVYTAPLYRKGLLAVPLFVEQTSVMTM